MARSLRWMLAGTLLSALPMLAACTANAPPAPEPRPKPFQATQDQAYQARDYLFPPSESMRAVYSFTESTQLPSPQQSVTGTGSLTVQVTSYSPTRATLQSTTVTTGQDGRPQTEQTTSTMTVEADGTVVESDGGTLRYSNGIFTAAGATVAPASGSEIPEVRARLVGTETVTVPAGTFETVHLQEGPTTSGAPQSDLWVARGVGIVRQRLDATFPVRTGENQTTTQQARSTYELRLESFTP